MTRSTGTVIDANSITSTSFCFTRWIDNNTGHLNFPPGFTSGHLVQSDPLFATSIANLYCHQVFFMSNRRWERQEHNGTWMPWREVSFIS